MVSWGGEGVEARYSRDWDASERDVEEEREDEDEDALLPLRLWTGM
jgi:hypothetical protein